MLAGIIHDGSAKRISHTTIQIHSMTPFAPTISECSALRFGSSASYNMPPCEASMPSTIRPSGRFPVPRAVTYNAGHSKAKVRCDTSDDC